MGGQLIPETVLNFNNISPLAWSSAMNSPFSRPVNSSPPSVASMPAERHRDFPFGFAADRIERHVIAPRLARRRGAEARLHAGGAGAQAEFEPGGFPRSSRRRARSSD